MYYNGEYRKLEDNNWNSKKEELDTIKNIYINPNNEEDYITYHSVIDINWLIICIIFILVGLITLGGVVFEV